MGRKNRKGRRQRDIYLPGFDMSELSNISLEVKSRDGRCLRCSSKDNLTAAHLAPIKKLAEFGCDPCNPRFLITLCKDCHDLYDDAMAFIHFPYMRLTKRIKLALKIVFRKRLLYNGKANNSKNR